MERSSTPIERAVQLEKAAAAQHRPEARPPVGANRTSTHAKHTTQAVRPKGKLPNERKAKRTIQILPGQGIGEGTQTTGKAVTWH